MDSYLLNIRGVKNAQVEENCDIQFKSTLKAGNLPSTSLEVDGHGIDLE